MFPLGAGIIAGVFCAMLLVRFAKRRRPHEGLWAIALAMYAAASIAMFLGVAAGWTPAEFRWYWLFGAVLNVPFLAAGELFVLTRARWARGGTLALLLAATGIATWSITVAAIQGDALRSALPLGKEAFGDNTAPYRLSQLYAFPAYFFLLGGSVWSALKMRGRSELRDRTTGTVAIAVGATIVAIGSGVGAGFDIVPLFSLSLAAGIAVMFWGFIRATAPSSRRRLASQG